MTRKTPWTRHWAVSIPAVAVLIYYAWLVAPGGGLFATFKGNGSYYNLLISGFRTGHLSLAVKVPPAVLALKDPYDPAQNVPFGLHDASYYKGKYYLYFGPGPAVALYWPFTALTGRYLEDRQALFVFSSVAFLAGVLLLVAIKRHCFPTLSTLKELGGVLAIGLTNLVPVLLRREEIHETAIASANAFFMLALLFLFVALHSRRGALWLSLASLSFGFAIASRPTYVLGTPLLFVPLWSAHNQRIDVDWSGAARWVGLAAAALIPLGVVVGFVLIYNALRFDNPFEFGYRFAFSGSYESKLNHFQLAYVWYNCRVYLLAPSHFSTYFPFVRVPSMPPAPKGYLGVDDPYGIIPNIPFVLLALASPFGWTNRPKLRVFLIGLAVSSAGVAAGLFSFLAASNRYMVDFLPGFVVLAVVGFWSLPERRHCIYSALSAAAWLALFWSVFFNIFAAFGHNEYLRIGNPAIFRRLVHFFDYPRFLVDRATGRSYGPLELTVRFRKSEAGLTEPLVVTGTSFLSDYLYVHHLGEGVLRIGFEHTGYDGPVSEAIPVDFSLPHRITVDMPPLYPPVGDPYFDAVPARRVDTFAEHLKVAFDDRPIIDAAEQFYPALRSRPNIGVAGPNQSAFGRRFTGEIMNARTLPKDWNTLSPVQVGPLVITLVFPNDRTGTCEPLVSSGFAGRGDVLKVTYPDSWHAIFTLDHWGYGGPSSDAVPIKPGTLQTLEVRFGSFYPETERPPEASPDSWTKAASRLEVSLDGKLVFDAPATFYEAPGETVAVGRNAIGASGCVATFGGRILTVRRGSAR
ncbi:MAG: hypothetical protein ABSH26_17305 [Opitutaceae bacterium]|jgi:hypothetical protein